MNSTNGTGAIRAKNTFDLPCINDYQIPGNKNNDANNFKKQLEQKPSGETPHKPVATLNSANRHGIDNAVTLLENNDQGRNSNSDGTFMPNPADGNVENEIDVADRDMRNNISEAIHIIEQNSWDDPDEKLSAEIQLCEVTGMKGPVQDTTLDAIKQGQPAVILNNFYKVTNSEKETLPENVKKTITTLELNQLGREVAGIDGNISAEDLNALDLNGDGSLTQNEVNAKLNQFNTELKNDHTEINIDQTVNNLEKLQLNFNGPASAPDGRLDYAMNIKLSDYQNILDNQKGSKMLLEKFYNAPVLNDRGAVDYVNLGLNEFGKRIAGEDNSISKNDLKALDIDGNGSINREELNANLKELSSSISESVHYVESTSINDKKDYALEKSIQFNKEDVEKIKDINILKAFYEESHTLNHSNGHGEPVPVTYYEMTNIGQTFAGKDGKISVDELTALDLDKNGSLSKEEIEGKMKEIYDSNTTPIDKAVNTIDWFSHILPNKDDVWGPRRLPSEITLNTGVADAMEKYEQINLVLKSFYKYDSTIQETRLKETWEPNTDWGIEDPPPSITDDYTFNDVADVYKLNKLGRFIAGDDGVITIDKLKALDTSGNGELSQQEIDAKLREMESTL